MIYLTEIKAFDPQDGRLKTWVGPRIKARSLEEANKIIQQTGLGYCRIIGSLKEEIETDIKIFKLN